MAQNIDYRLQLRSCKTLFADRQAAEQYIKRGNVDFARNGLFGEPVLLFYGDKDAPNMMLVVGSNMQMAGAETSDAMPSYSIIDDSNTIKEYITEMGVDPETVNAISDKLNRTINTLGLVVVEDDNLRYPEVVYEPETERLNGLTVTEAIDTLADEIDGLAEVKISKKDENNHDFDDNILGYVTDGLLAAVNLDFDPNTNTLTFSRSGVDKTDGNKFKTDAFQKNIVLNSPKIVREASYNPATNELVITFEGDVPNTVRIPVSGLIDEFRANNNGRTVTVNINTDGEGGFTEFSADVNLASTDNLIEKTNGTLRVSANAVETIADRSAATVETRLNTVISQLNTNKADKSYVDESVTGVVSDITYEDKKLMVSYKNTEGSTALDLRDLVDDYILTPATDDKLGGVIIEEGSGLAIDEEGHLSVDIEDHDTTYTAGNGITISRNNEISVRLDGHDPFLTLDIYGDGSDTALHTTGIPEAIADATGELANAIESEYVKKNDVVVNSSELTASNANPVSAKVLLEYGTAIQTNINGKQDILTFDSTPTAGSDNPVTSDGILSALNTKQDVISDLAAIREGAASGDTALQDSDVNGWLTDVSMESEGSEPTLLFSRNGQETKRVEFKSGNGITMSKGQGGSNEIYASAKLSQETGNALSLKTDGLFADAYTKADADNKFVSGSGINEYGFITKTEADNTYAVPSDLDAYVEKVNGKGLSSNDFTNELKTKLDSLSQITIDSELSPTSTNPVMNKVVTNALNSKQQSLTSSETVAITDYNGNPQPNVLLNDNLNDNIITKNGGLYANVDIIVNSAANTITLRRSGNEDKTIALPELPGVKTVESSSYNATTKTLTIVFAGDDHPSVTIPVADLVGDMRLTVLNGVNEPVTLTLSESQSGGQTLAASFDASKLNLIPDGSDSKIILTPNGANRRMAAKVDVEGLVSVEIEGDNNALQYNASTNSLFVKDLEPRIVQAEATVGSYETRLQEMAAMITNLSNQITDYENRISELETYINERMLDFNDVNADGQIDENDNIDF